LIASTKLNDAQLKLVRFATKQVTIC